MLVSAIRWIPFGMRLNRIKWEKVHFKPWTCRGWAEWTLKSKSRSIAPWTLQSRSKSNLRIISQTGIADVDRDCWGNACSAHGWAGPVHGSACCALLLPFFVRYLFFLFGFSLVVLLSFSFSFLFIFIFFCFSFFMISFFYFLRIIFLFILQKSSSCIIKCSLYIRNCSMNINCSLCFWKFFSGILPKYLMCI